MNKPTESMLRLAESFYKQARKLLAREDLCWICYFERWFCMNSHGSKLCKNCFENQYLRMH